MFCQKHHDQYDGRRRPRLRLLRDRPDLGCNGPMRYLDEVA